MRLPQLFRLATTKFGIHALLLYSTLLACYELPGQEFILPSSSIDIGIHASMTHFNLREASPQQYVGFTPGASVAVHTNLNKQFTHTFYVSGEMVFAASILGQHTNGLGYAAGYKVAMLRAPFGIISGLGFKNQLFFPQEIGLSDVFWLSQIFIPAEVYWSKQLPSKDAVLVQLSTPLVAMIAATDLQAGQPQENWLTLVDKVAVANSDYGFSLPLRDYTGIKFAAAFVHTLSKTSALKIGYFMQYFHLYAPENKLLDNGLLLQWQF